MHTNARLVIIEIKIKVKYYNNKLYETKTLHNLIYLYVNKNLINEIKTLNFIFKFIAAELISLPRLKH